MDLRIVEEALTRKTLEDYGRISIAFVVSSRLRLDLADGGLGGITLTEEPVEPPRLKDYDAEEGDDPRRWAERWDLSRWRLISAFDGQKRIGGAVVALNGPGMWFLRGRDDMAALWDLRIDPEYRRRGVGKALFATAADWARRQGCRQLKIETQNINVPACRFYAAMGARLGGIDRFAYSNLPDEVEMDWFLAL